MPRLIRLYITNVAIGFALSAVFLGMLIGFNLGNLRHLILETDMGYVAAAMIFMANGIIFAGVQFGIAVMRLAQDDDDTPRGGLRQHAVLAPVKLAPAKVAQTSARHPRRSGE